ncbi:MAG TPA: alpha/beta hydrolase domain-containing protein, partial [Acidimicrobiales bacterium]
GDVWVGVSAQKIGVSGGPVLVSVPGTASVTGKGLVAIDPARYGSLVHPGDGYSFDMYTQVARAVRAGGPAMGGLTPTRILAAGESQSAIALTTYVNGVQPLTHAFDGFFVHSRASVPLPLVGPGQYADLSSAITGLKPTVLRTDTDVPTIDIQAESDVTGVLDSVLARQPDTSRFRLWEVAGTSHADVHLLGSTTPLPAARITALYPSRSVYVQRYAADSTRTIRAGFVLAADRPALLAFADPSKVPG